MQLAKPDPVYRRMPQKQRPELRRSVVFKRGLTAFLHDLCGRRFPQRAKLRDQWVVRRRRPRPSARNARPTSANEPGSGTEALKVNVS